MVDWCKWIWPPKSYPSPCTHRVSAPYTSQKIHWHYCGQFVNLSRGIFDFQGAEFGSTWNPSWRSEINRVETTTSNSCCGWKLAPCEAKKSVSRFQNLFEMNFLNEKWVFNPLAIKKTHFDSKKMPFLKLNDFLTNCCIDWHFHCFWSQKIPKTTDSGHQSFTFVLFCWLLAENFKKSAEKETYEVLLTGGAVFSEAPCTTSFNNKGVARLLTSFPPSWR